MPGMPSLSEASASWLPRDPLLSTKLYAPPTRPNWVPRCRLSQRLDEALRLGQRLTLVSAPAGFGKTTLIGAWLARSPSPRAAWVSLDPLDNDPGRFLAYLIAALQSADESLGRAVKGQLAPQMPPPQTLLTALINELSALSEPLVLVLDDYHLISAPAIHGALQFLLEHQPPPLHLVVITRADPPISLARLRGRGQLLEIRAEDLRFTTDEAAEFLNQVLGLSLSAEDISALEMRTEGWIAGLQMAALALQGLLATQRRQDVSHFIHAFSGSHRYILEYLVEEVLGRQPAEVQSFLLQTSILDRLSAPLCDALMAHDQLQMASDQTPNPQSQILLERLEKANLFLVPVDDERHWYRYHRLFADLLDNRLRQAVSQEHINALHLRASQWLEQNGYVDDAVRHALAAQDLERAATMVERTAADVIRTGRMATLRNWLEALPEDLLHARPHLRVYVGWIQYMDGKTRLAEQTMREVKDALQALPRSPLNDAHIGQAAACLAQNATLSGDTTRAIQLAQEALTHLPEEDLVNRSSATFAMAMAYGFQGDMTRAGQALLESLQAALACGQMLLAAHILAFAATGRASMGQLHEASRRYQEVVQLGAAQQATHFLSGIGYVGLAEIAIEWNDLPAASGYLDKGLQLCDLGGIWLYLFRGYVALARLRQALGDLEGAAEALRRAEQVYYVETSPLFMAQLAAQQVQLDLATGNLGRAARSASRPTEPPDHTAPGGPLPAFAREIQQTTLARVHLAKGQPELALQLLAQADASAEAGGRPGRNIEIYALQALALHASGHSPEALAHLQRCLSLAEPEGYVRLFLDAGEPMRLQISKLRSGLERQQHPTQDEKARRLLSYLDRLLATFVSPRPQEAMAPTPDLPEPLSERELGVLRLIAEGCSNQEIAARLVLTLHTVKKHTGNIFGKLGVASRTQAVARARQLDLLP